MHISSSWVKYIIILFVVAGVGAGAFLYFKKPAVKVETPVAATTPTPVPFDLTTWTDEAGFSFQYPKELSVNKHEEDPDNYAHVELTNRDHPGKVIVWVKDLPAGVTTLDSWVKKLYPDAITLDTKLGSEPAKKIRSDAPVHTLTTGAISDNLLFYVEGTLTDNEYWTRVHDTITGSFAFTDAGSPADTSGNASGGSDIDEEVVLQ